jgi:hypothetical protein
MHNLSKVVILIADPSTTKHHRIKMEEMGSKVIHSVSLKEITEAINNKFDLIILDLTYELAKRASKLFYNKIKESKAILIIGEGISKESLQKDFKDAIILEKPLSPSLLNDEVAKALSIPSRRPIRILVRIQALDQAGKSFFLGTLTDISENGMLIETEKKLMVGERLHISFYLPETGGFVELIGQVSREAKAIAPKINSYGIRFIEVQENFQSKINRFVLRMKMKK